MNRLYKSTLFIAILMVYSQAVFSQLEKGTHSLGLDFSGGTFKDSWEVGGANFGSLRITPSYSYFFRDGLAMITGATANRRTQEWSFIDGNPNERLIRDFRVFSGIRKHVQVAEKFYLLGTLGAFYQHENEELYLLMGSPLQEETVERKRDMGVFAEGGIIYFPNPRWSIELIFQQGDLARMKNSSRSSQGEGEVTGYRLGIKGMMDQPTLGIRYYFLQKP
ncbi:MAG: hypothetical protein JJU34_00510 [Lunatimonas sp.]|uniref:hypothetical protein n=1 Tax=Lunatimonas sp. TaxID=2060141 RepID=UPI00263BE19A|nr:hypothetical protein [Lunatimonas sp.]MCC5935737.1 hypothetical protein [Lunatimonas sp.]